MHLREGTATARLSFRYRVDSDGPGEDYDWFIAAVTDGEGRLRRVLRRHGRRSDWETVTADLSAYSGQAIGIQFAVRNDGQAGRTWALVDDVSLCVTSAEPLLSPPTGCWLGGGLSDYAPVGLPDFDQRQRSWTVPDTDQYCQVLMLLGFWEMQPSGLRWLGGHYVSVAGVGCEGDRIALSDPWRDGIGSITPPAASTSSRAAIRPTVASRRRLFVSGPSRAPAQQRWSGALRHPARPT